MVLHRPRSILSWDRWAITEGRLGRCLCCPEVRRSTPAILTIVDPPATDQRGFERIIDGNYDRVAQNDIGAFEYVPEPSRVLARHVFYNNSGFDGNDPSAGAADAAAIALDKTPLMPWQTATFANYTSYSKGINGIIVDIVRLPARVVDGGRFRVPGGQQQQSGQLDAGAGSAVDQRLPRHGSRRLRPRDDHLARRRDQEPVAAGDDQGEREHPPARRRRLLLRQRHRRIGQLEKATPSSTLPTRSSPATPCMGR